MYAQKVEGDAWAGEKLDKRKIDKMSGRSYLDCQSSPTCLTPTWFSRSTNGTALRIAAGNSGEGT